MRQTMFTPNNFNNGPAGDRFSVTKERDVLHNTPDTFQPQTNWEHARKNLPGRASATSAATKVFVSSAPARFIRLIVGPACAPVAGTFVLWVSNTENDPFRHKATGASSCLLQKSSTPESLRSRTPAYKNDNEDWITFPAFTGFAGMVIGWSCVGWGTCWWSPSCLEYGGFHSAFIRNPPTYGFAAWHDSYAGTFGRGAGCVWSIRRRRRLRGVQPPHGRVRTRWRRRWTIRLTRSHDARVER